MTAKNKFTNPKREKIKFTVKPILLIVLLLLIVVLYIKPPFKAVDLTDLTVTGDKPITIHTGRYANYGYAITGSGYEAKFTIDNCVNFVCDRNRLSEIKAGDILQIQFDKLYSASLTDIEMEIPVYALVLNNETIFSSDDYLHGRKKQNVRRFLLLSIIGLGVFILSSDIKRTKIAWLILILYAVIILVLIQIKIV